MKLNQLLFIVVFTLSALSLNAQIHKVSGKILAENENPIEYANVILTNSNTNKIDGTITTNNGLFELKVIPSKYKLTVNILGYETYTSEVNIDNEIHLGSIKLKAVALQLNEAVVTAKLIDRKADRFIMNIQGNQTTAGKNTSELLSLAPSVWVDRQTGININGKTDVKVMINDRIINMSKDELLNYLETIKAEDIQSIEIITDPGAEYQADSSSGIIHIKLKRGFRGGLTGSISMNYSRMRDNSSYRPSINLNYRKNKLSLYGSIAYNDGKWESDWISKTNFTDQNIETKGENRNKASYNSLRATFGSVYEINDNHDVGFTFETRNGENDDINRANNDLYINNVLSKSTQSTANLKPKFERYDASLNYKFKTDTLGSNLKVFLDYTKNDSKNNRIWTDYYNSNTNPDSMYRAFIPSIYDIYAIRADYVKKFNEKTSISFGGRYGYAEMNYKSKHDFLKNNTWVEVPEFTDNYDYSENIGALYAKFDSKLGNLTYTLGLRYENTTLNIAKEYKPCYNDIFPSIFLKYTINEKKGHSISANYNRKLSRPYFTALNPFKQWEDEYRYNVGNPNLRPTYANAYSLSVTLFDKYMLTAQYTKQVDVTSRVMQNAPEPGVTMTRMENIDKSDMYYISLYAPVKVTKWYNFTASLSTSQQTYEWNTMSNSSWIVRGYTQHTLTLPKNWTVSLSGWFGSKAKYYNMEIGSMGGIDGSISKRMFNNKLVATLNVWNIQGFRYVDIDIKAPNYFREENVLNQNQVFNFTLTYNFSMGKKVNVKKAEKGIEEDRLN